MMGTQETAVQRERERVLPLFGCGACGCADALHRGMIYENRTGMFISLAETSRNVARGVAVPSRRACPTQRVGHAYIISFACDV